MANAEAGRDIFSVAGNLTEESLDFAGGSVKAKSVFIGGQHVHGRPTDQPKPKPVYLPQKPANFVPREPYFEKLRAALLGTEDGMFLLSGEPGSGKSSLALTFAWQVQKQFEAVVFQTCGQRSVEVIIGELADTLKEQIGDQITQQPADQKLRAIKSWLQQRRSLLVLDDVWLEEKEPCGTAAPGGVLSGVVLLQGSSLHLQDLLPGPPVSVLFTSRRPRLPWVATEQSVRLEAFTEAEVEQTFRNYLGPQVFERHRAALVQFAERVERLPLAVAVGAQLLQEEFGPLDEAARGLELGKLISEIHNVPGLLERAIRAQGEAEQHLLAAAAVCSLEGFWLPLAISIAGLGPGQGATARNRLVNAGLLRVTDQDRQRFHLHSLLHDQLRQMAADRLDVLREQHALALERLFKNWESGWKDCRECLLEIIPAGQRLFQNGETYRAAVLMYQGYATAQRIGELALALQIEESEEDLWLAGNSPQAKDGLQRSYGNQALILQAWGRLEEAMALLKKQEVICEELGNKGSLGRSYGNQALILKAWGKLEEAMALHKKQEAICEELGNKNDLQGSYGNQALILKEWGKLEEAMALHKKEEAICEELGNKNDLQGSYGNQALILQDWGKLEEAMALHKKKEAICEELGNKNSLQISYGNQAVILQAWGKLEEAMALIKTRETICLELGNKAHRGICYWSWGLLARAMKDHQTAREKLEAALAIFTELKMPRERNAVQAELNRGEAAGAG